MSQMLKSSGAMAVATLASRILGMVREMVYARFMGDGPVAGAFMLAFTIPNLFRRLLGEGALTAAFIPIFKEKERTASREEMWRAANAVVSGLLVAAGAIIVLVIAGISVVLAAATLEPETQLMLELLRVMFPYMMLVCLTAVFMGMLNARGHFFIPAMGATMLNVVMIASVFLIAPQLGATLERQIFGLAIGVLLAGLAQAGFQMPVLRKEGYRFNWVAPWQNETVRQVVRKMIPGTIGVAAFQINVLLTQGIAFMTDPTIVASFNYAVRLLELPQGLFGVSLATFLLPTLAGMAAEKNFNEFRATVGQGMNHLIYVNLPASIMLLVLAMPIVRLLFERGEFGPDATARAAYAMVCLAPSLVAYSLVNILARAFFALGDTKTPMKISVICLAINLVLVVLLVETYRQGGLGLANTASAWLNAGLLLFALRKRLARFSLEPVARNLAPVALAGLLAGLAAWGLSRQWEIHLGSANLALNIGSVFVPLLAAGVVYVGVTLVFKVDSAGEIFGLIAKKTGALLGRRR